MLYFSKLRILFITLFSLLFILFASSNLFKIDDGFFDKKINLGLDLQGGSYLLLEVQTNVLIKEEFENFSDTVRIISRENRIKINNVELLNEELKIRFETSDNLDLISFK